MKKLKNIDFDLVYFSFDFYQSNQDNIFSEDKVMKKKGLIYIETPLFYIPIDFKKRKLIKNQMIKYVS